MLAIQIDTDQQIDYSKPIRISAGDIFKKEINMNEESNVINKIVIEKQQQVDESKTKAT